MSNPILTNLVSIFQNCSVVIRDRPTDRQSEFTGPGLVRANEGTNIVFTVDDVPKTTHYDVVIRYIPQGQGDWDDVRTTIERPDIYDPSSPAPCNVDPTTETNIPTTLSEYERKAVALYDVCLESEKRYKVIISFHRQNRYQDNPAAQILIDSIALIPKIEVTSIFTGSPPAENRLREFMRFNCNTTYYDVNYDQKLNDQCRDLLMKTSVVEFNGAVRK